MDRVRSPFVWLAGAAVALLAMGLVAWGPAGSEAPPVAELPLSPVIPVEAFHFAWHAFYPQSESPGDAVSQDG